jgi:hypothetical protein
MSNAGPKRWRHELSRRRAARARRAEQVQANRAKAELDRALGLGWTPRRIVAWSMLALAALIAVQHVIAHNGFQPIPLSMGWQDLLVGYPVAGLLAIAGGIALGK